ncbi:uncharacterized protein DUF3659 [Arcticibacter tournemirensis]|uniref:DUF3659 domain-containing protein n=1 Tax=Arcticibacter tournemirensis TaxID=699437 RepID=A0A5M9GHG9_9SPHI|nr:DUF3659 domain-containing protein [Arcticibacter tournemirensis]KAA8473886.1 DUF3659 domain-containing protein [Arcticibacter tournemirensis]TQM49548.1 uncharacterized protein DUF3659 [Arcticibacter tournemirensis]
MKTLYFFFLVLLSVFGASSFDAKAQSTSASERSIIINKKGEIFDHGWNKLGYITSDNIAKNNKGKTIYFINKNGNVIDANGKNLGRAAKNGNYYNLSGENVITVRDKNAEECDILDPQGHKLGTVHKNYKLHACATHCFFLAKEKEKRVGN